MIQVAIGHEDPGNRGVPLDLRPQVATGLDLRADLRRSVDQEPGFAVGADCDRFLRSRPHAAARTARFPAVETAAIPLRRAATGGRPQDADLQTGPGWRTSRLAVVRFGLVVTLDDRVARVAIGEIALVAADFRAHVDFNEGRGFPLHGAS